MRVVITGATGNVGTSLLQRVAHDADIQEVVGVARRAPRAQFPRTRFEQADVATDSLDHIFAGADAVVHLAWRLQPSHDPRSLARTNVEGSGRVFDAAVRAGVGTLLYASSIATYASGPKDLRVDESWSTDGISSSTYSRQKARVEHLLDEVEGVTPSTRVVRMRPALVFRRTAASDIRRLFLGPLVPRRLFDRRVLRAIPDHPRLCFQAVHSDDVAEAFRLALHRDVRGAFNLAAEPVLDPATLAGLFGARRVPMPAHVIRGAASVSWQLRLQCSEPGWVDLALGLPLIDSRRANDQLRWWPERRADSALLELVHGLREGAGFDTPPLAPRRGRRRFEPADPESRLSRFAV